MTLLEFRMFQTQSWYSIPELATRWQTDSRKICAVLEEYNIRPERFKCRGWVYWQIDGLAVINIEKGQRVLFS